MNSVQFFDTLKQYADPTQWRITKGLIRRVKGHYMCPVAFVGSALTGKKYRLQVCGPARAIGLNTKTALRIAAAADSLTVHPRVRRNLLNALGLTE